MTSVIYILKIIYYFSFVFFTYMVSKKYYKTNDKLPIIVILFLCMFFGVYSIICGKYPYASDRLNFAFRFESDIYTEFVKNESYGLYILESVLHFFTYEPKVLFFTVAFFYMFIILFAYKKCKLMQPYSLLFLLITTYPIYGLYMLKQALAMAFVTLAFSYYQEKKIKSLICLIIAILFHEVAWIMIPLFIMMKLYSRNIISKKIIYLILIIIVLFFSQLNSYLVAVTIKILPSLGYQLKAYLNSSDSSIISGNNLMTIFKGIPFYSIFLYGLLNKNKFLDDRKRYDIYMFWTFILSITIILSKYMYWMYRFGLLLYFPVSIFAFEIYKKLSKKNDRCIYLLLTYGISLYLSIRLWFQYYFLYGGL